MTGSGRSPFLMKIMFPALTLLLMQACSSGVGRGESPTHEFGIQTVDGVPVAVTKGGPKYTDPLFDYEVLFHLEQDESREETILSSARWFLMDEEGFVYVNDTDNYRIAVFDSEGRYSHSIGGQGRGPGEFQYPMLMYVGDGTVIVNDNMQLRTSLFKSNGEFVRSSQYARSTMMLPAIYTSMSAYPGPDGSTIINQQGFVQMEPEPGVAFRVAVVSAELETLAEITSTPSRLPGAFQGLPMVHYRHDHGIMSTKIDEPVIEWYGLDGVLQKVIRVEMERERVTEEEQNAVTRQLRDAIQNAENDRDRDRAQRELDDLSFPDYKDYWMGISVDAYGYIWAAEPTGSYLSPVHETRRRILSPEGEYLGDTRFPELEFAYSQATPSRGHLLCAYEDPETFAPMVVVLKIEPAVQGFDYP